MRAKDKKIFELSAIKKYKQYERRLWLLPLACMIFTAIIPGDKIPGDKTIFGKFTEDPGFATFVGIILFLALGSMILSIIPFFIGKILIKTHLKTTIQNCTITNMQDFDYYRDKLTGLSPATISILTDLDIEQKKDVAASILQYENLGLLEENPDHTYRATKKYYSCTDLNNSDRYLIEHLEKGDFNWEDDKQWKRMVMDEAISEGYISKKLIQKPVQPDQQLQRSDSQKKSVSIKWRLIQLLLGAVWVFWFLNAYLRMEELQPLIQAATMENRENLLLYLYEHPKVPLVYVEFAALFISAILIIAYKPGRNKHKKAGSKKGCLIPLAVVLVWFCWVMSAIPRISELTKILKSAPEGASLGEQVKFISQNNLISGCIEVILMFIYLMFMIAFVLSASRVGKIIMKNNKPIKRTEYGNQMAECVYGMKNFIHDYSNLSLADRHQAVLWEDYLVYAVVLEENEEIVNEISRTRREVL
ncbi:MAG: DUF2207 family protein [Porcipelethomonas sp.]